jgi:hypothetical protein
MVLRPFNILAPPHRPARPDAWTACDPTARDALGDAEYLVGGGDSFGREPLVMIRDASFEEAADGARSERIETPRIDDVDAAAEMDVWFADASVGVSGSAPDADAELSRAPVGAASLPQQRGLVQPGRRRPVVSSRRVKQGRRWSPRSERVQRTRTRRLVLLALTVGAVLLAVIVLPERSSAPGQSAGSSTADSSRTVIATGLRAEQRRERAHARRAARALTRRRAVARERRAASRRADDGQSNQRGQVVPVRTPDRVPASQFAEPLATRPQLQRPTPSALKSDPPATTGEFEP